MFAIIGLGNPGDKYIDTRHNTGFMVIDKLADDLNIKVEKLKHKALVGEGRIGDEKVILAKPQTFMNLSGESVLAIKNFYKLKDSHIIIIYDDIDIDIGRIRIRRSGSGGSHKGMQSIIYHLNSENFPRIRVGIGKPPEHVDLVSYVLSPFSSQEAPYMAKSIQDAAEGAKLIITEGISYAMNEYNGG
ncbi:MAG TPA: aminoacyl-tRNA hydrolase [Clostridiales bacterium]|nr:aminoacyl-tRNA hydrolase [Clostridiales bacterium]